MEHLTAFGLDHPAQAFEVLEYKAQILQAMKRPDDALAVYGEALQYKPTAIPVLLARGALLEQEGRIREALADLERAVEIAPDDPMAANAYGYILANRTRQARKAWRYVRRAYEIEPGSAAIQDSVGWTLFKLGRTEEARSHLEEALDRLPDPGDRQPPRRRALEAGRPGHGHRPAPVGRGGVSGQQAGARHCRTPAGLADAAHGAPGEVPAAGPPDRRPARPAARPRRGWARTRRRIRPRGAPPSRPSAPGKPGAGLR